MRHTFLPVAVVLAVAGCDGADPSPIGPSATFTASCNALICAFSNASTAGDSEIERYDWDFGDETAGATTRDAMHAYASPGGRFEVRLTVTDAAGEAAAITAAVTVSTPSQAPVPPPTPGVPTVVVPAPLADFVSICTNLLCRFIDQSLGSTGAGTLTHSWNFGDGTPPGAGRDLVHQYAEDGSYDITLTVRDAVGQIASTKRSVLLSEPNLPPVAEFATVCDGRRCQFHDFSEDPNSNGAIAAWHWEFGGGAFSSERNPSHEFSGDGRHTATLTVTDNRGATATRTRSFYAPQPNPVASFVVTCERVQCAFTNTSTGLEFDVWDATWEFGDGSTSHEWHGVHSYTLSAPAKITVKLTLVSSEIWIASAEQEITVTP